MSPCDTLTYDTATFTLMHSTITTITYRDQKDHNKNQNTGHSQNLNKQIKTWALPQFHFSIIQKCFSKFHKENFRMLVQIQITVFVVKIGSSRNLSETI